MSLRESMCDSPNQQAKMLEMKKYSSTSILSTKASMPATLKSKAKDMNRQTSRLKWQVKPQSDFSSEVGIAFNQPSQSARYQKHEIGIQ